MVYDECYMKLCKTFRWIFNLPQKELSELMGVSLSTVKSWESKRRPMSVQAIRFLEIYVQKFESLAFHPEFIDKYDFFALVESCYEDVFRRTLKGVPHT